MKNLTLISIALLLVASQLNAQWTFGIITEQQYNNNPFQSPLPIETLVSSYDFTISNTLDNLELSYYGSLINFEKIPDRNFYWHQLAISKSFEDKEFGIIAEQRIGKNIYTYFDFKTITAFYTQNIDFEYFNFTFNPIFNYSGYDEISILNNIKLTLNYKFVKGFETGTTIFLGGGFNYKKYLDPVQSGYYSYYDQNNILQKEFYTDKNINSLSNVLSYFRIAQSITETTGFAFQFTNRSILNSIANTDKELNIIYGDESEIFDDPTNTEGNLYAAELTKIFFEDLQLKLGYYFNKKFYPTQGNYDEQGNYFTDKLRSDKQTIFGISLSKNFSFDFLGDSALNVSLNFQNIKNTSTSYWFNYKNTTFSVNLGLQF